MDLSEPTSAVYYVDIHNWFTFSIPIEQRPAIEACLIRGAIYPPPNGDEKPQAVVMFTPPGLDADSIYNPSFDVTPAELITAIVTERGVATRKEGESTFNLNAVV